MINKGNDAMRQLCILLAVLLVAGCASFGSTPVRPTSTGKTIKSAKGSAPSDKPIIETSIATEPGVTDLEIYEGTGQFINEEAARGRPPSVAEDGEIVLNFEGESIQSVVHTILGEVLQETFVIAPGVGGEVTFSTSKPVTREQTLSFIVANIAPGTRVPIELARTAAGRTTNISTARNRKCRHEMSVT